MGNIPVLKPSEVIAILKNLGFAEVRQKGSHKQFRHQDGRGTSVPFCVIETAPILDVNEVTSPLDIFKNFKNYNFRFLSDLQFFYYLTVASG